MCRQIDLRYLFDQPIGTGEDRSRNSDAKFLRYLEIDEELELRGLFGW